jgi:hypothetical protein
MGIFHKGFVLSFSQLILFLSGTFLILYKKAVWSLIELEKVRLKDTAIELKKEKIHFFLNEKIHNSSEQLSPKDILIISSLNLKGNFNDDLENLNNAILFILLKIYLEIKGEHSEDLEEKSFCDYRDIIKNKNLSEEDILNFLIEENIIDHIWHEIIKEFYVNFQTIIESQSDLFHYKKTGLYKLLYFKLENQTEHYSFMMKTGITLVSGLYNIYIYHAYIKPNENQKN